jgi:hypothetical protein
MLGLCGYEALRSDAGFDESPMLVSDHRHLWSIEETVSVRCSGGKVLSGAMKRGQINWHIPTTPIFVSNSMLVYEM